MNPKLFLSIVTCTLFACSPAAEEPRSIETLIELLANRGAYADTPINAFGFLQRGGGYLLFISRESAMAEDVASSVIVQIESIDAECEGTFVFVSGHVSTTSDPSPYLFPTSIRRGNVGSPCEFEPLR